MSETIDEADEAPAETDPNFSVTQHVVRQNNKDLAAMTFTFGEPKRTITTVELSLGDQFDLIEVAGEESTNSTWMLMASLAFATFEIDGVPAQAVKKRQYIRSTLDRIKPEGLSAYFKALRSAREPDSAVVSAAKNS